MNKKDCKGCMLNPAYTCVWFNKNEVCPCSICLVKIMCGIKCDLFVKYQVKIHDLRVESRRLI
jgi:hypothetical protein